MSLMDKHQFIERNATLLLVGSLLVVSIGGIVEIAPLFYLENTIEKVEGMRPYSPLELAGRNIYIREGCYVCHSQMIRPRDVVPESIMPSYAFLKETPLKVTDVGMELKANALVGVPYTQEMIDSARADLVAQADPNADTSALLARYPKAKVGDFDGDPTKLTEMDALVAYLQMLGTLVDFSTYDDATGYR